MLLTTRSKKLATIHLPADLTSSTPQQPRYWLPFLALALAPIPKNQSVSRLDFRSGSRIILLVFIQKPCSNCLDISSFSLCLPHHFPVLVIIFYYSSKLSRKFSFSTVAHLFRGINYQDRVAVNLSSITRCCFEIELLLLLSTMTSSTPVSQRHPRVVALPYCGLGPVVGKPRRSHILLHFISNNSSEGSE
jgi:hypothetical protein